MSQATSTPTAPWLASAAPVCEVVAALLAPHAEVVVHDLATDRILAIWNAFSGRRPGDSSLLAELPESWETAPVQGPYAKTGRDGGQLSAVSAVLRDEDGTPRGLLCVNLDRSPLLDLRAALDELFAPRVAQPPELFERDWREAINDHVEAFVREYAHGDRRRLTREQRLELVRGLDAAGLFAVRRAADHVASATRLSRATVYALLKQARG